MYSSFEKRNSPSYKFGVIPDPAVYTALISLILLGLGLTELDLEKKILKFLGGSGLLVLTIYIFINYKDWLLLAAKRQGSRMNKLKTFSLKKYKSLLTGISFETFTDEYILKNNDGTLSLCFRWKGIDERNLSIAELEQEHNSRVTFLKSITADSGISIEHHFLRLKDASLIDKYKKYHEAIKDSKKIKPIAHQIKMDLAEQYRPLARSNVVYTVITIGKAHRFGILDSILPALSKLQKKQISQAAQLREIYQAVKSDYIKAQILERDEFTDLIQQIYNPFVNKIGIDWRYNIASQLISEKPVQNDKTLQIGDTFFRLVLLENYPEMKLKWSNAYCERSTNLHVVQFIQPVDTSIAIDKTATKDVDEQRATKGAKGQYRLGAKLADSRAFKSYVTSTNNSIHKNFFLLTVFGKSEKEVIFHSDEIFKTINKARGKARTDIDLQTAMFYSRLPTQCRRSPFVRAQDHADTLALMMPFSTFKTGAKKPESLRMTSSGSPVFYSPSNLEVPHELCVAEMGGGKDTQLGLTIAETYQDIRYDIIELGTSYRGIIEAIGGRYCKAREQVINPLASYEEFTNASKQFEGSDGNLSSNFISMQTVIVRPIFKDLTEVEFTIIEELVINKAIRLLFEEPLPSKEAPLLPDLANALNDIELTENRHIEVRDKLKEKLDDFLLTEVGENFKKEDQFIISPIANAIDFDKFDGKLFEFFLTFVCTRLITNAMSSNTRNQIVLNEYGMLTEKAPDVMRTVTMTLDRMGRKELCGLSRNTQEMGDITQIGTGAINAIKNKILLSRADEHSSISELIAMPEMLVTAWQSFISPEVMDEMENKYRESIVCQRGEWYRLYLKFPQLLLDLMNTRGGDKQIREKVFGTTKDPYERIALFRKLKKEKDIENENIII